MKKRDQVLGVAGFVLAIHYAKVAHLVTVEVASSVALRIAIVKNVETSCYLQNPRVL